MSPSRRAAGELIRKPRPLAVNNVGFLAPLRSVQFSSVIYYFLSSIIIFKVQFSSVQFSSVQFSSVQFSSVQFRSVQCLSLIINPKFSVVPGRRRDGNASPSGYLENKSEIQNDPQFNDPQFNDPQFNDHSGSETCFHPPLTKSTAQIKTSPLPFENGSDVTMCDWGTGASC